MYTFKRDSTLIEKLLILISTLALLLSMAAILLGVLTKRGTISPGTWNIPFMDGGMPPELGGTLLTWGLIGLGVTVVLIVVAKVFMK